MNICYVSKLRFLFARVIQATIWKCSVVIGISLSWFFVVLRASLLPGATL